MLLSLSVSEVKGGAVDTSLTLIWISGAGESVTGCYPTAAHISMINNEPAWSLTWDLPVS